jgi:hypothetical protein
MENIAMDTKQSRVLVTAASVALIAAVFQMAQAHHGPSEQPSFLPSQEALQETYNLSGFPNEVLVLMDTTHVGDIVSGHVVATLPSEPADGEENLCQNPPAKGLSVLVGVAPDVKAVTLENTGVTTGRLVDFDGQEVVNCVFHVDIEPGMEGLVETEDGSTTTTIIDRITDIAFINGVAGSYLPDGTSIGVAVRLSDTSATHGHHHAR